MKNIDDIIISHYNKELKTWCLIIFKICLDGDLHENMFYTIKQWDDLVKLLSWEEYDIIGQIDLTTTRRICFSDTVFPFTFTEFLDYVKKQEMVCDSHKGIIAWEAFTRYECKSCGKIGMNHNTFVSILCESCEKSLWVCKYCLLWEKVE